MSNWNSLLKTHNINFIEICYKYTINYFIVRTLCVKTYSKISNISIVLEKNNAVKNPKTLVYRYDCIIKEGLQIEFIYYK